MGSSCCCGTPPVEDRANEVKIDIVNLEPPKAPEVQNRKFLDSFILIIFHLVKTMRHTETINDVAEPIISSFWRSLSMSGKKEKLKLEDCDEWLETIE